MVQDGSSVKGCETELHKHREAKVESEHLRSSDLLTLPKQVQPQPIAQDSI